MNGNELQVNGLYYGVGIGVALLLLVLWRLWCRRQQRLKRQQRHEQLQHAIRRAEQAEQRQRLILDSLVDAVVTINRNGIMTDFSRGAVAMFGYTQEEMVGRNIAILMPEPFASEHDSYLAHYHQHGQAKVIGLVREVTARRRSGAIFPIELRVTEINLAGETFYSGVMRDMTEQRLAEQQLKQALRYQKRIADISVLLLAGGDCQRNIKMLITQLREVTDVARAYLFENFNHTESGDLAMRYAYEACAEGIKPEIENPLYTEIPYQDGLQRWQERLQQGQPISGLVSSLPSSEREILDPQGIRSILIVPLEVGGEWYGFIGFDETRYDRQWQEGEIAIITTAASMLGNYIYQNRIEHHLHEAKRAAEIATEAKSNFLANMSHEIRTPMNAIMGMAYLALQGELSFKQRDYIGKVHQSAENLLRIINDILDFSKIEAGKMSIEQANFSLHEVLKNLAVLLGIQAQRKGIELLFAVDPNLPPQLIGDPLRLEQILLNLGNNAIKFTHAGGDVVIAITQTAQSEQQITLNFTVQDSGIGMTFEQQKRLFQSFSQADNSTTRQYGGTGLGLTISRRLTHLMGGEIRVESEFGVGSLFTLTLPFQKQSQQQSLRDGLQAIGDRRVLVVDDNRTSCQIHVGMVTGLGLRASFCDSGSGALEEIQRSCRSGDPYQLILLDCQIPDLKGRELVQILQTLPAIDPKPKVVVVSIYDSQTVQLRLDSLPVDGVVTKPLIPKMLQEVLLSLFGEEPKRFEYSILQPDLSELTRPLVGARLLLVEDNEINQQLAVELLTSHGLIVEVAQNGAEALQRLSQNRYDGVLMDCQMPVMDGFMATRELRKRPDLADLPVIALTANAMSGDRERVLQVGMNDFISKPFKVLEMFTTLARWIKPSLVVPLVESSAPLLSHAVAAPAAVNLADLEPLPLLAGINWTDGLAMVGGKMAFYRKQLEKFRIRYSPFIRQLDLLMDHEADREGAVRLAHSLKGAAGMLGIYRVQQAAGDLERQLVIDAGDYSAELAELEQALNEVLTELTHLAAKG